MKTVIEKDILPGHYLNELALIEAAHDGFELSGQRNDPTISIRRASPVDSREWLDCINFLKLDIQDVEAQTVSLYAWQGPSL
jgi:hypothetical protein